MSGVVSGEQSITALSDLTAQCRTRDEYAVARLEWLERAIGVDTTYIGAASPGLRREPRVSGVSAPRVAACEAQIARYWDDLNALNQAAARAGGAVHDQDVFSLEARERMPFYREVVRGHGIRATAASLLRAQGKVLGCLYLGRTSRGARFGDELELLRRALPVLSLGALLFDAPATTDAEERNGMHEPIFTKRELQVLEHLVRGLSNRQIAAQLGSSPFTVKNQVAGMLAKAGVKNRAELSHLASQSRFVRTGSRFVGGQSG